MIKIKVCGMRDPLNVIEVIETKPDYMGFIFYPGSPRYIGEEPDISLFQNVPVGILKVGVFVNETPAKIQDIVQDAGLDLIQLHGHEPPEYCSILRSAGLIIIKALSITDDFDFKELVSYKKSCDYFLFDTKSDKPGGSGRKFNWDILSRYSLDIPFFLSGGISPEDSVMIRSIEHNGFYAVDVNSLFETSPGVKDASLLKAFIETVK